MSLQIEEIKAQLLELHKDKENYTLLQSIPDIGLITAAALMASVGDANAF